MTMVSHKYKFIFIKPGKVAGSSVLQALGKQAGPEDIVVSTRDTEGLERHEQNNLMPGLNYFRDSTYPGGIIPAPSMDTILKEHMVPHEIKEIIGEEVWNTYCKITIVRNPWDRLVSSYCWNEGDGVDATLFEPDLENPRFRSRFWYTVATAAGINEKYYFMKNHQPVADFYMRYESLNKDYQHICKQLGIPIEELPTLKKRDTKFKNPYWEYYDAHLRQFVREKCDRTIEYFGYKFENDKSY